MRGGLRHPYDHWSSSLHCLFQMLLRFFDVSFGQVVKYFLRMRVSLTGMFVGLDGVFESLLAVGMFAFTVFFDQLVKLVHLVFGVFNKFRSQFFSMFVLLVHLFFSFVVLQGLCD